MVRDKPRIGRPSYVDEDMMAKIRKKLTDSNTGWDTNQVMDLIQKKTGIKNHREHIRRLLHKWGFSPRVRRKGLSRGLPKKRKRVLKKDTRDAKHIQKGLVYISAG